MKVFTSTDFEGFWPVGTAAVIIAESEEDALEALMLKLKEIGLSRQERMPTVQRLPANKRRVVILDDGNY